MIFFEEQVNEEWREQYLILADWRIIFSRYLFELSYRRRRSRGRGWKDTLNDNWRRRSRGRKWKEGVVLSAAFHGSLWSFTWERDKEGTSPGFAKHTHTYTRHSCIYQLRHTEEYLKHGFDRSRSLIIIFIPTSLNTRKILGRRIGPSLDKAGGGDKEEAGEWVDALKMLLSTFIACKLSLQSLYLNTALYYSINGYAEMKKKNEKKEIQRRDEGTAFVLFLAIEGRTINYSCWSVIRRIFLHIRTEEKDEEERKEDVRRRSRAIKFIVIDEQFYE